jgi:hypothetical protein
MYQRVHAILPALSDEAGENRYPTTGFLQDMVNIATFRTRE